MPGTEGSTRALVLDFGPGSVDGWLASARGPRELERGRGPAARPESARELAGAGPGGVDLTPARARDCSTTSANAKGRIVHPQRAAARGLGGHRVHRRQQRRRRRRKRAAPQAGHRGAGRGDRARQRLPPAGGLARSHQLVPDPHRGLIAPSSNGTAAGIPLRSSSIHRSPRPSARAATTKEPHVRPPAPHHADRNRGTRAAPDDAEPGRSCA